MLITSLSMVWTGAVSAQTSEPLSQESVAQNCSKSQIYLKTFLRPRDLKTRVDRLQAYLYIHGRLDTLVKRLEHNSQIGATELRQSLDILNDSIETFKSDYESYDVAREAVSNFKNCSSKAAEFVAKLETARAGRQKVNDDIDILQSLMSITISQQLANLQQQLLATGQSEAAR